MLSRRPLAVPGAWDPNGGVVSRRGGNCWEVEGCSAASPAVSRACVRARVYLRPRAAAGPAALLLWLTMVANRRLAAATPSREAARSSPPSGHSQIAPSPRPPRRGQLGLQALAVRGSAVGTRCPLP